jgi:hypothetical protein
MFDVRVEMEISLHDSSPPDLFMLHGVDRKLGWLL